LVYLIRTKHFKEEEERAEVCSRHPCFSSILPFFSEFVFLFLMCESGIMKFVQ
jgi:hypothetical protein